MLAGERPTGGWALPGPFGPMLLSPAVGDPLQELGAAVRYRGLLDDATRELAIVATAAACRSRYELDHHVLLARAAGVPQRVLDAVLGDREVAQQDGAAVVHACGQLARTGTVDPETFAAIEGGLGRPQAFELLVLAGYYRLLATVLATYGIG